LNKLILHFDHHKNIIIAVKTGLGELCFSTILNT